jgi:DNA-binding transcriptional regulator YiaG
MRAIEHIRKNVFRVSQSGLANIAGVTQATVSRWERGELEPGRIELEQIRSAARKLNLSWDDSWFFEIPSPEQQGAVS